MDDEESALKLAGEYASIGLDDNDTPGSDAVLFGLDDFKEFCKQYRAQAIAEEREACAKVCEEKHINGNWKYDTREECADAIRKGE